EVVTRLVLFDHRLETESLHRDRNRRLSMSTTAVRRRKGPVLVTLLVLLAVMIVAFVIVVAMQPSEYHVARSTTVDAPPEVVFAQVNDFHKWEVWNPWGKIDPEMSATFSGEPAGVGAKYAWSGNSEVGAGSMTIVESTPNERIRVQLDFEKPMKGTSMAEFTFVPQGGATDVTWSIEGENSFLAKAIGLALDMDAMIGGAFEQGLA